ncbi:hypothetical protein V866_006900 [Kwoniella sp. B9012]
MPPVTPTRPRQLQSCVGCRGIKVRCVGNEDQTVQCHRCSAERLKIPCVYSSQRRGRKTNVERAARNSASAQPNPQTPKSQTANVVTSLMSDSSVPVEVAPYQSTNPLLLTSPSLTLQDISVHPQSSTNSAPPGLTTTPASITSLPAAAPRLDVSEYLDPPLPPATGIFDLAHTNITPPTGRTDTVKSSQFDDPMHTLDFLRETSTCLLTAVLAAACKFFRKDLYHKLIEHAQTLTTREISAGTCDIGTIQSLLILVCWKEPTDRSAWIKIGMAIRLGYQHGWYIPPKRVLPLKDREARLILNTERTWYNLICFDRKYSRRFGLPTMIRSSEYGDPETWAQEHMHLDTPMDMHLACSIEMTNIYETFERYDRNPPGTAEFWTIILSDMAAEHERKKAKWFARIEGLSQYSGMALRLLILDATLTIKRRALECNVGIDGGINDCLVAISELVDQVEVLSNAGMLIYLHDVTACTLSEATMLMYKSRAPSPATHNDRIEENAEDGFAFLEAIDDFMHTSETQNDLTREDEQFWMSLFAPTGTETVLPWFGDS